MPTFDYSGRSPSQIMRFYGWAQGAEQDEHGRVCALGALRIATSARWTLAGDDVWADNVCAQRLQWTEMFMAKAAELFPDDPIVLTCQAEHQLLPEQRSWGSWVAAFNDFHARTEDEVLTVLEKIEADGL